MSSLSDVLARWQAQPATVAGPLPRYTTASGDASAPPHHADGSFAPGCTGQDTLALTSTIASAACPSPAPTPSVIGAVNAARASMATFDEKAARRKSMAILAAGGATAVALGQAATALLPASAALGVAATLSVGVAACMNLAVSETMHGLRDPGLMFGSGVLTFFAGFMQPSVTASWGPLGALAVSAGMVGLMTLGMGRNLETSHRHLPERIDDAVRVDEKYARYQQQHEELVAEMQRQAAQATGSTGTSTP